MLIPLLLAFLAQVDTQTTTPHPAPSVAQVPTGGFYHARIEAAVMGTELVIEAWHRDELTAKRAVPAAEKEIRRVEDVMTDWRASPLETLNASAGRGPQIVPKELTHLIARSLEFGNITDGAFDITFGSVGRLWNFKTDPPVVPTAQDLNSALQHVGWQSLKVDLKKSTVHLPAGMRIGLGGVAKGYGVDRAMAVLLKHGIEHGLVNAGGDLKALGRDLKAKPSTRTNSQPPTPEQQTAPLWEITIKHPRNRDRFIAKLPISNRSVVTSGDYERFFEVDGKRFHHILNPATGLPATGCMSATIVAPDAAMADALATAMCVMGVERGLALIEKIKRVDAILVSLDGKVHLSSGLLK